MTYKRSPKRKPSCPEANCVSLVLIQTAFILIRTSFGLVIVGIGCSMTVYSAGRHFLGATRVRVVGGNLDILF